MWEQRENVSQVQSYIMAKKRSDRHREAGIVMWCKACRGRMIRIVRESLGMSLKSLGKMCGVSHVAIRDIEIGKTDPTMTQIMELSRHLKLEPGDLL